MKILSPFDRAAFAELADLCRIDAERPSGPYRLNGSFIEEERNGGSGRYWYYRGYERSLDGSPGKATKTYVGPIGDAAVEAAVAAHAVAKTSYTTRRQLVSRLKRAGLPAPDPMEGAVLGVLAETGLFAAGAVVVGSAAFQTYGGLLGIRMEQGHYKTRDIDVAQPRGIAVHPGAAGPLDMLAAPLDMLAALKGLDPTFVPLFLASEPRLVSGFANGQGFRLEFLTPQTAERKGARLLREMSGLPGVGAQPLKFLEFSLVETTRSVVLHEAGHLVPVPDPARYAVHKLIVATLRGATDASKTLKDILQAQDIVDGIAHVRDTMRLGAAWLDAWNRGPNWRKALRQGTLRLSPAHLSPLSGAVTEAAIFSGELSPFAGDADARTALLRS